MDTDERYMWMALDLARQGRGRTSPNPMVGSVVVRGAKVVGSGFHQAAGLPHAEALALKQAGAQAKGATLYVNLEPCSHRGKTGPCTEAIIKAGISRVVAAITDPNPLVAGRGFQRLKEAGVKVAEGVLASEACRLNEAFIKFITTGLPFVTVKVAMSLDGKTGTVTGDSKWITGEKARRHVHRLRDRTDAIMVGIETVLKDNPRLTTRLEKGGGRDPLRVIVDSTARFPLDACMLNCGSAAKTLVAVTEQASFEKCRALEAKGAQVIVLPAKEKRVDLQALLKKLGEKNLVNLFVEGGGTLNYSLLAHGLVDKLYVFIAPLVIGGSKSPTPFDGAGIELMQSAWAVEEVEIKRFDRDILIKGYPKRAESFVK